MTLLPRKPKIFMMDLWAIVPYYTAYLTRSLLQEGADLTIGSINYYLDPTCFSSRGLHLAPGPLNIVGSYRLPKVPRRILKLIESSINLCVLSLRFFASPPDILHVQFLPMLRFRIPLDLWFVRMVQRRGAKIVFTVHDLLPHDTGERYKSVFVCLYREVDSIICHSEYISAKLQSDFAVPREKIHVIPHGPFFYDLPVPEKGEDFQRLQKRPLQPIFLFQGIILPYKGVELLLNAWARVERECAEGHLVVCGTGAPELLDQIRAQIRALGLERVSLDFRFISAEELVGLYQAADVVVYPYRAVTTSGALATGLALGKAIVASDLLVFRELLENEHSALLIDPENPDQFAAALLRLAREPGVREALSERVRKMNFGDQTWQAIARKTMLSYEEVLIGAKSPLASAR